MAPSHSRSSDVDLASRASEGDEDALGLLYDRHAEDLYSMAVAMLKDPADAEEVVTDAFLKLWEGGYDPARGTVGAFLNVVVRSRSLDAVRARRRRGRAEKEGARDSVSGFALPVASPGPDPETAVEEGARRSQVRDALAELTEKQRAAISLAYLSGMTHREIAAHLSEPLGTVKTRIRDGMQQLRDIVRPTAAEAP